MSKRQHASAVPTYGWWTRRRLPGRSWSGSPSTGRSGSRESFAFPRAFGDLYRGCERIATSVGRFFLWRWQAKTVPEGSPVAAEARRIQPEIAQIEIADETSVG